MIENFCVLFLLYIMYSMIGWLLEVIVCFLENHKFINRGFLVGPYCPIYGKGALAIILLLQKYKNDIIALFVMSMILCSIVEYLAGYILEKIFHTRWWDYSNRKFNVNGRICIQNLLGFGLLGVFLLKFVNPFLYGLMNQLSPLTLYIITAIILILFITDYIISFKIILKFKTISKNAKTDSTEIVTKYVKEEIAEMNKLLYNRIVKAFPKFETYKKTNKD